MGLMIASLGWAAAPPTEPGRVRIGIAQTLFRVGSQEVLHAMKAPFERLLAKQTGLEGEIVPAHDAMELGRMLNDGQVDLIIVQGIEFAWAQSRYPELRPLVLAVNQHTHLRACLVVRDDKGARQLADLRGHALDQPAWLRLHCELFLRHKCQELGVADPNQFFSSVHRGGDAEEVLDRVVDGRSPVGLVEKVSLDCYQQRKPGRAGQLRTLAESEVFPASVVAYRPGRLPEATLDQFQRGLLRAHQMPLGRHLLLLWKLSGFEPIPRDFEETVRNIVKIYPSPDKAAEVTLNVGRAGGTAPRR